MPKKEIYEMLINRFEKAAVAKSWMGSQPPGIWESIEEDYKEARLNLLSYLKED